MYAVQLFKLLHLTTEMDLRKDLELQIQLLEDQLASRRAGKKGRRQSVNPLSPMPSVKTKEQKVTKASSPASSAAVVRVKREELQNEENCSDIVSSTLSAEEATDLFIAELKQDMRMSSGMYISSIVHNDSIVLLRTQGSLNWSN